MKTRDIILQQLAAVVAEYSPVALQNGITEDTTLDELWLDSLEGNFDAQTFGEFVALYSVVSHDQ